MPYYIHPTDITADAITAYVAETDTIDGLVLRALRDACAYYRQHTESQSAQVTAFLTWADAWLAAPVYDEPTYAYAWQAYSDFNDGIIESAAQALAYQVQRLMVIAKDCAQVSLARSRMPRTDALYVAFRTSAREAHEAKKTLATDALSLVVTFIASDEERDTWRQREQQKRKGRNGCQPLPWQWEPFQCSLDTLHYAYLSAEKPGLIAYTPSEEYGCADRQLRVRPGRYLEQFAPQLSKTQIDAYCAMVKAVDDANVVQYATTPADVEKVYRNGPSSCMSHSTSQYVVSTHPTRVYGDSPDLKLAYLGELSEARSRVLVWPEKKVFSRVYGDSTIGFLLKREGYESGDLIGARIRVIRDGDAYVMPFIDGCSWVKRNGEYFTLVTDAERDNSSYSENYLCCQNTNGCTNDSRPNDDEEIYYCGRDGCDNQVGEDESYCRSCEHERMYCEHCDTDCFGQNGEYIRNVGNVCADCYDGLTRECEDCGERFAERAFSHDEQRRRRDADRTHLCEDCAVEYEREQAQARKDVELLLAELSYRLMTNGLMNARRKAPISSMQLRVSA